MDKIEKLHTLRHSCSHIMAQAVQKLYPQAKLAIGPAIENGFYYDFDIEGVTLSDENLKEIEKTMKKLIAQNKKKKLYLNPLIEYIKSRCYSAGKLPKISRAALGENSPLYGAAFVPLSKKRSAELSASIMCADILNMQKALSEIEESGIKYLHCDIMDNHFVPNLMLAPEFLNKLRGATSLPYDYHIMAQNPESIIEKLDIRRGDIISVHYESTPHIQRAVSMIKERGAKASVALNPSTPVSVLEEILAELDMVLIMSVNPGFAGQKIVSGSFEKISKMRKMIDEKQLGKLMIEVDGNCSFENAPKMYNAGADVLVVGTSSVFKPNMKIKDGVAKLNECLKECGA